MQPGVNNSRLKMKPKTKRKSATNKTARHSPVAHQRLVRAKLKDFLPKLPRAKRGKRFSFAIACLKLDMDYQRTNDDAMGRINIKDYEDAIATLQAVREKQPHRPNVKLCGGATVDSKQ